MDASSGRARRGFTASAPNQEQHHEARTQMTMPAFRIALHE
jgi:hypothetical protein